MSDPNPFLIDYDSAVGPSAQHSEVTLRDIFAALATHAYITSPGQTGDEARQNPTRAARWAYDQAEALLAQRAIREEADQASKLRRER